MRTSALTVETDRTATHAPLPIEALLSITDGEVVVRSARLLALALPARMPAVTASPFAPAGQLAFTRVLSEGLLSRMVLNWRGCASCRGPDLEFACARELGALESRLQSLSAGSSFALAESQKRA